MPPNESTVDNTLLAVPQAALTLAHPQEEKNFREAPRRMNRGLKTRGSAPVLRAFV